MGIFDLFRKKEEPKPQVTAPSEPVSEKERTAEVILKSRSPVSKVEAFVEKSESCYYFYLWFNPLSKDAKMKTCWVCNRRRAPQELDLDGMSNGKAPMMLAEYVAHDPNGIDLDEKSLSIVWFEEGSSAALLSGEEILCVIPDWSGYKDFHGYAKYAKGTGHYAWEITNALPGLTERVRSAQKLWAFFMKPENEKSWMMAQRAEIMKFIGTHENDFDITYRPNQQSWDPTFPKKVVVSGSRGGVVYGVTAGVSLVAMPMVDFHVDGDPKDTKRMELGFAAAEEFRQICRPMYGNLCMYANFPWDQFTFLAHGHTIPFRNLGGYAAVLFVNPRFVEGLESPSCTKFLDGSAINLLWVVPITQAEYDFAVQHSSAELLKKAADPSRIHIFDGKPKFIQ